MGLATINKSEEPKKPLLPKKVAPWACLSLLAMGTLLLSAALRHDPGLNVPTNIAILLAISLYAAAFAVITKRARQVHLTNALICVVLSGLTLTGAWVAFGPGQRTCFSSLSGSVALSNSACRYVFGAGVFVTASITGFAISIWWCSIIERVGKNLSKKRTK